MFIVQIILKNELKFEPYLQDLEPKYVFQLCKFRTESFKSPNVIGRHLNIDSNDRICELCNLQEKGDNYHYLFNCTQFKNERLKYIDLYIDKGILTSRSTKLKKLLNTSNVNTLKNISQFVYAVLSNLK